MNALREIYLKSLVSKSADLIPIKNNAGEIVGFGSNPEIVPITEVQKLANMDSYQAIQDANSVFDSIFPGFNLPPIDCTPSSSEVVSKSTTLDKNSCLDSIFPFVEVSKSARPTSGEMLNRISGKNSEPATTKPVGRPKTTPNSTPLDKFDPSNPQTTIELDNTGEKLKAGSVLEVHFPDDSVKFISLTGDTPFFLLWDSNNA